MRLEVHVFHHLADDGQSEKLDSVLRAILRLERDSKTMNTHLAAAIAAIQADDATLKEGIQQLLADDATAKQAITDAVKKALEEADVDDETAAAAIDTVDAALKAHTSDIMAVLQPAPPADPGAGEPAAPPADGGADGNVGQE